MDKDYWRLKKREQRAKLDKSVTKVGQKKELDIKLDTPKPEDIPEREWAYALERATRARRYAEKMPEFVRPGDLKYQDPMWQWENEVRGRFVSPVGGSLSGMRSQPS